MKAGNHAEAFDPVGLVSAFNARRVRYLLIGRQAVVLYGAPLFSFDYDFWVHPEDRDKTYEVLEAAGLLSRHPIEDNKPIVMFENDEGVKIDIFFVSRMSSDSKGVDLVFDEVFQRAIVKADPKADFYIRLPAIEDLISLKMLAGDRPKDLEDIEYLRVIQSSGPSHGGAW
jgi:hypothetical protein